MQNHWRPVPGRAGTHPLFISLDGIGGANWLGGASPLTASGTTVFYLPPIPRRAMFARFGARCVQVPASASGTLLASVRKYRAVQNDTVTLSKTIDLEALVTRETTWADYLPGLRDADLFLNPGDGLEVTVVSTNTIGTQPTFLGFTAEVYLID